MRCLCKYDGPHAVHTGVPRSSSGRLIGRAREASQLPLRQRRVQQSCSRKFSTRPALARSLGQVAMQTQLGASPEEATADGSSTACQHAAKELLNKFSPASWPLTVSRSHPLRRCYTWQMDVRRN